MLKMTKHHGQEKQSLLYLPIPTS